jgi:hypothetical protein
MISMVTKTLEISAEAFLMRHSDYNTGWTMPAQLRSTGGSQAEQIYGAALRWLEEERFDCLKAGEQPHSANEI